MNNKVVHIVPLIFLITIMVITPLPTYAKDYQSTVEMSSNLLNECSSDEGSTNCANNNAETYGDENNVSPQVSQSSEIETGSDGEQGPPGPSFESRALIYTVAEIVPPSDIVFNRIGGLADPSNTRLNNDFGDSENPAVAVSGNNVYVVWDNDTPTASEILYRLSLDGGASFGDIISLSNGITRAKNPVIGLAGNSVFVVWSDNGTILLRKSTDGGANFGPPVLVSTLTQPTGNAVIDMAIVGNSVYLVWSENITGDEEGDEIFFSKSIDSGNTFSEKLNLSQNDDDSSNPSIAVDHDKVHIVWNDQSVTPTHITEILYRRSLDGGQTFETAKNLSNTPSSSFTPTIAVMQDRLYIAWSDNSAGDFEILFTVSQDGGNTFDAAERISHNPGDSRRPIIKASQNEIYIVWDTPGGIFFIRSQDGGTMFGAATIIILGSFDPAMAVSQNIA